METDQEQRFAEAVERKTEQAEEASHAPHAENPSGSSASPASQESLVKQGTQDVADPRASNSRHKQVTADT